MKIIKRDGRESQFNLHKIENAILKSFIAVDGEVSNYARDKAENIAQYIENYAIKENKTLSVDEIQDLVEKGLMSTKRKDVARAYITYRNERDTIRTRNSQLRQNIVEKLKAQNVQNQNANVDEHSFGGRIGEASGVQMKDIALNDIVSPMAKENHLGNMIYIHDLDSYAVGMHNCLTIPFDDLLANGFNTRQTDVRPANSVNTAFQLVAVLFQLQSLQQFGGVAASHLDWTMVPYVRKSFVKHYKNGLKYLEDDNTSEEYLNKLSDAESYMNTLSIEDDYFFDGYIIAFMDEKVAISGPAKAVLEEDKILKRLGYSLPFVVDLSNQLKLFGKSLEEQGLGRSKLANWAEAFNYLKEKISELKTLKKVVFLDEASWLDSSKSDFMPALKDFWVNWASQRRDIILIVCSSFMSWLQRKFAAEGKGLRDYITVDIELQPLVLQQCKELLASRNLEFSKMSILQFYMVLGGVPYYWTMLKDDMNVKKY